MSTERLEVRPDAQRRRKLTAIARQRGLPIAAVVRELIDALEDVRRDERLAAAPRIIASERYLIRLMLRR